MNILIISDNEKIKNEIARILKSKSIINYTLIESKSLDLNDSKVINDLIEKYQLVISAHCKKMFPSSLFNKIRCINIHPGFNPYNRGWYPQVFSIINKLPLGVTIHEIDEQLDHGDIILQEEINCYQHDTSLSLYNRIIDLEIKLFESNFDKIIYNKYTKSKMLTEGNINYKQDFNNLCTLDLNHKGTLNEHIDYLRALTHGNFNNAYFFDNNGDKIFVKIILTKQ